MKITKLRLEHYERLELRNIQVFEITPEALFQMMIGTNGSGKSSIMDEMSPLPAERARYKPKGSKRIWIDHRNHRYDLKSWFLEGTKEVNKHSFIRDGQELNDGHTITVQRDLVLQHFGVTKEIHDFAMGRTRFSNLDAAKRRKWFTMIDPTDHTYALDLFTKLKKRERDTAGALSLMKKRLVNETAKILPQAELDYLTQETERLHAHVEFLQENRQPLNATSHQAINELYTYNAVLVQEAKALVLRAQQVDVEMPSDHDQLDEQILQQRAVVRACAQLSIQYMNQFEEIDRTFQALERTHTQSIAAIDVEITDLERRSHALRESKVLRLNESDDPYAALTALKTSSDWITHILETLPKNSEQRFTRAELESRTATLQVIDGIILHQFTEAGKLRSRLQHYESLRTQDPTTCPNCDHTWIKDYDPQIVESLKLELTGREEELRKREKEQAECQQAIREIQEYFQIYRQYTETTSRWPVLRELWDYIQDSGTLVSNPTMVLATIENYKSDLAIEVQILEIAQQIAERQKLLEATQANAGLDFESVKAQRAQMEETILLNQRESLDAQRRAQRLERHQLDLRTVQTNTQRLEDLVAKSVEMTDEAIESTRREHYQDLIRDLQVRLATSAKALREAQDQAKIIADIELQISFCEQEHRCLGVLVQELSPTEGLIAEGLFGFMKLYIRQVNALIAKIWTYPMEVYPCELDAEQKVDLDYEFPLKIEGSSKTRKDISQGSDGMREVIDLGFRLTGMKALGLGDYPLFLDEFGRTMDPAHKAATVDLINAIMAQDSFSQLFMISHDIGQYGGIANSELCVLCEANVVVPQGTTYNRHIVMQ